MHSAPHETASSRRGFPRKQKPTAENGDHSRQDPPVKVFFENEPCQQGSQRAFQIQEQRRRRSRGDLETEHQQDGRNNPARQDSKTEPR
jgi:hypothetical protein